MRFLISEQDAFAKPLSPVEIGGLVVGVMFAVLLAFFLMLLYYRERRKQLNKRGLVSGYVILCRESTTEE